MALPFSPTRSIANELSNSSIKRTLFLEEVTPVQQSTATLMEHQQEEENQTVNPTKSLMSSTMNPSPQRSPKRSPKRTSLSTITNTTTYLNNNNNSNKNSNSYNTMKFKTVKTRSQSESPRRLSKHSFGSLHYRPNDENSVNSNGNGNGNPPKHDTRGKARAASATRANMNIQQIRQQIQQSQIRGNHYNNRVVNIPMNKVTEMRQILFEENKRQNEKLKLQGYLSAKKRAEIKERLNKVEDIHKMLDEGMRHNGAGSGNGNGNHGGNGKAKSLNLPLNRVNEMKSWLVEFEKQNKNNSTKKGSGKNTSGTSSSSARKHIPRIGGRNQPYELDREAHEHVPRGNVSGSGSSILSSGSFEVDEGALPQVSELKQWLVDFELKNKAHYEKGTMRPKGGLGIVRVPRSSNNHKNSRDKIKDQTKERPKASVASTKEGGGKAEVVDKDQTATVDKSKEGVPNVEKGGDGTSDNTSVSVADDEAIRVVENTSMLEKDHANELNMNNISMMPGASHQGDDDDDGYEEWEDDYEELTKVDIDIEPVVSADWEKESVISPDAFSAVDGGAFFKPGTDTDTGAGTDDAEHKSKDEMAKLQAEHKPAQDQGRKLDKVQEQEAEEKKKCNNDAPNDGDDDDQEKVAVAFTAEFARADGMDPHQHMTEPDYEDMTFADETISKLSFDDGGPMGMGVLTMKDFGPTSTLEEKSFCSHSQTEELLGVDILSKSVSAGRFSNTNDNAEAKVSSVAAKPSKKPIAIKAKKKGLGRYFKAFTKMLKGGKSNKTSKAAALYEQEMGDAEEAVPPTAFKHDDTKNSSAMAARVQPSTKSLEISPDSQQKHPYLPNTYNINPLAQPGYAHGMFSKGQGYNNNSDGSPMSLASAYRRAMSPTSSSMSGFTDVEACMTHSNNVAQHVGWLQDVFGPTAKIGGASGQSEKKHSTMPRLNEC